MLLAIKATCSGYSDWNGPNMRAEHVASDSRPNARPGFDGAMTLPKAPPLFAALEQLGLKLDPPAPGVRRDRPGGEAKPQLGC
jgi:hypothetical protein